MLSLPQSVQIYLAREAVDMRKGFDGLAALVHQRNLDIYSGNLFVFLSKRRDRAKILLWDSGGFVLYYKRLERGRFRLPVFDKDTIELESVQLMMLLSGIDLANVRKKLHWKPPQRKQTIDTSART